MRVTCSEEMFATPFTAWLAMPVKSGPPTAGAAARGAGASVVGAAAGVAARESDADRIRPVMTSPPTNPATTSASESAVRFMSRRP